jgi:carbon starvation protein
MLQKIPSYTVAGTSKWLGRKLLWALIAILGAFSLGIVALSGEISAAWLVIAAVCVYLVAFRFYALFIANWSWRRSVKADSGIPSQ